MPEEEQSAAPGTCPVLMSDLKPCGRLTLEEKPDEDQRLVCLMHSNDPQKDKVQFQIEINAILEGFSILHGPSRHDLNSNKFDFTFFVFPEAEFVGKTFTKEAVFNRALFSQQANFGQAKFDQIVTFNCTRFHGAAVFTKATFSDQVFFFDAEFRQVAVFQEATFVKRVDFDWAEFNKEADLIATKFEEDAVFSGAIFAQRANFIESKFFCTSIFESTQFKEPKLVRFFQVNKGMANRLRARFLNCEMEEVHFEDVHWNREHGRMVLQDEIDIRSKGEKEKDYELVAVAYRRLINNFEKARKYNLAEDCSIGAMKMQRLNPENFLFGGFKSLRKFYKRYRWPRKVGKLMRWLNPIYFFLKRFKFMRNFCARYFWLRKITMKLKRLNPLNLLLVPWFIRSLYNRHSWARKLGEWVSILNFYRLLSNYGSSYTRALGVLLFWLLLFAGLYTWTGLEPKSLEATTFIQVPLALPNWLIQLGAGFLHSFEVATFQRNPVFTPINIWGRIVAIFETVLIPGQLALLFLALRRRFRR